MGRRGTIQGKENQHGRIVRGSLPTLKSMQRLIYHTPLSPDVMVEKADGPVRTTPGSCESLVGTCPTRSPRTLCRRTPSYEGESRRGLIGGIRNLDLSLVSIH